MSKTLTATAILIGGIVGVGFLGIPYVVAKTGLALGMILLVVIASIMLLTMLHLGEVVLRTQERHQLTGYAEKYLGSHGKKAMLVSLIFGVYSALVAYLIVQGESWSMLLIGNTSAVLPIGIAVWAIMSALTYFDLKALKEGELIGVTIIVIMIISIVISSWNSLEFTNLTTVDFSQILAPFGVMLFAFLGYSAVPEIVRVLGKDRQSLKPAIYHSHIFVLLMYAIFTCIVLGLHGTNTPEIATLALGAPFITLGIVTVLMAYLSLSVSLTDTFHTDYKMTKRESWMYTTLIPLALFVVLQLTHNASFTTILSFGGIIAGGIAIVLIMMMAKQAKIHGDRHPEYKIKHSHILTLVIVLLCIAAMAVEIKSLF